MNRNKQIASLQQIKALAEEILREIGDQQTRGSGKKKKPIRAGNHDHFQNTSFDKPLRPFMKTYSKNLSGPKKFTLLLAWHVKGDVKKEMALSDIEKNWNRMTSLLGMKFNRYFSAEAKNNDWVESKKPGRYNLRPAWQDVLRG